VTRRAFKDAGRINNDIKSLNAKLKTFEGDQQDLEQSIAAQQAELTSLRNQLENSQGELNNITSSADLEVYNVLRKLKWEIQDVLQDYDKIPETERRVHETELKTYIFEIKEICSRYDWDPEANREQNVPSKEIEKEQPEAQLLKEVGNSPEPGVPVLSQKQELSAEEVKARLINLKEKLVIVSQEVDKAVEEERYDDAETHQTELEETEAAIRSLEASCKAESVDVVEGEVSKTTKDVAIEEEGVVNGSMTAPCSTITSEAPNQSHMDFKSNHSQIDLKSDEVEGQPSMDVNEARTESKISSTSTNESKSTTTTGTKNLNACQEEENTPKAKLPIVDVEQENSKRVVDNQQEGSSCAEEPVEGLFEGLNV